MGLQKRQTGIIKLVTDSIYQLHLFLAENKSEYTTFIELNILFEKYIGDLISNKFEDMAQTSIWTFQKIFLLHWNDNLPEEDEIWLLKTLDNKTEEIKNIKADLQWNNISNQFIYTINSIAQKSIENSNKQVAITCLQCMNDLVWEILDTKKGNRMKKIVIHRLYYYMKTLTIQLYKTFYQYPDTFLFKYDEYQIRKLFYVDSENLLQQPLMLISETLIELAKVNVRSTYLLDTLSGLIYFLQEKLDENVIFEKSLIFIYQTYHQLFKLALNCKDEGTTKYLVEIQKTIEYTSKEFRDKFQKNMNVKNQLDSILEDINKQIGSNKSADDYIPWPV